MMPIQAPQWTEFLSCPVCYNVFNEEHYRPISLACGHTVCRTCLSKFQQRKCPFDQSLISRDIDDLPANFALLQLVSVTASPDNSKNCVPDEYRKYYDQSRQCVEELALLLKPVSSSSTGSIISVSTSNTSNTGMPNCVLSRPMQRKLITLVNCQLVEEEGRARALRAARSLGERTVTELILQHQNPQQLSSNLWAAVRGRGCQFLGPGMQEEVLKLILLALEDGSALSRKVLVLFVVQRLEAQYPQASKTAIGHVVQLLYRASCFKVTKREEESSLMQLKEEYRTYETLRREHDSQIVQIAMEAGLRIAPDQWSSLLYGDSTHKSHMQSIIDKLQTPQTFSQSVNELLIALQRTGDPYSLSKLRPELEFLSNIDPSPDVPSPTWENLDGVLRAVKTVIEGLVKFLQSAGVRKPDLTMPFNARYKTSLCRDFLERGSCPRANSCTFAHSEEELEKYRQKSRKTVRGPGGYKEDDRLRLDKSDIDKPNLLSRSDSRLGGYPQSRGPLTGPPPQLTPPQLAQHPQAAQLPQLVPPPQAAHPPQAVPAPMETQSGQAIEAVPVDVAGNVIPQPVEMVLTPSGDIVPPPGTPNANYVMPAPGYVTPVDPSTHPPIGDSPSTGMPPNGDTAIVQAGNTIPPGGSIILQQEMPRGMVPPPVRVAPNPQGVMQSHVNMDMQQGAVMQGGSTSVPPNMSPMPGMMYPYMPPYPAPGNGMMGPRFSMHPMMYGQYPYPAMHPYMAYYQQGFVPPDNSQMQYDNYYTSLNPFAEPWKPGMGRMPSHDPRSHGLEKCSVCSQRDEEEQRRRHLCDKHKNQHETEWKESDKMTEDPNNKQKYAKEGWKNCVDHSVSKTKQQSQNGYRQGELEENTYHSDSAKLKKYSESEGYSYQQDDTKAKMEESQQEWSTIDDDEGDNSSEKGASEFYDYSSQQERERTKRKDEQYERNSFQQLKQRGSDEQPTAEPDQWSGPSSSFNTKDSTTQKKESFNPVLASIALNTSKTPPIPLLTEPNAKLYRQSLNNLREKRNSLIQQLQEINKEATAQEHKLEELSESAPNLFRFEPLALQEFSDGSLDEATVYASTLQHPEPLDTGPFSLKTAAPTNGEIFERLGAISGVPPRSVNDSIIASWTAKTLKYSESEQRRLESSQVEAYKIGPAESSSKTVASNTAKESSSSKWSNIDQDFPYWKDVTQNLDSPLTTPPNTPCPSSVSTSLYSLKATSGGPIGSYSSSYQPVSQSSRNTTYSHMSEPVHSTSSSVYGQSASYNTKMSSGSASSGLRASTYVSSTPASASYDSRASAFVSSSPASIGYSSRASTYVSSTPASTGYSSRAPTYVSSTPASTGYSSRPSTYVSSTPSSASYGSRASTFVSSSSVPSNRQTYKYNEGYDVGNLSGVSRANSTKVLSDEVDSVQSSIPQSGTYQTDSAQRSKGTITTTGFWPSTSKATSTSEDVSTATSYIPSTAMYGTYGTSSQTYSSVSFSGFQNSTSEEDHIPFVEGSPIISKYGPISRSVNKNLQQNTQPVKVVADDATKTIPVTAVTPLKGPPLPSAQKVPSRFTQPGNGQVRPSGKTSSPLTAYEKSYSLWTTELNLLEQKAKKASTEDEMLSVKLQAVQMQIALKEQELQQAQLLDSSICSEYLKRTDPKL